jgi:hypothetical protein
MARTLAHPAGRGAYDAAVRRSGGERVVGWLVLIGLLAGCAPTAREVREGDGPVAVREADGPPLEAGGSLEAALGDGTSRRSHRVRVGEGQTVEVGMIGLDSGFDAYLRAYDDEGRLVAEDDDGGDGLNSRIVLSTATPALFTVEAASFGDDDEGRYRLEVVAVPAAARPRPDQILLTEVVDAGPDDAATEHPVTASRGELLLVTVDVLEGGLDPFVELVNPDGGVVGADDDGGGGRNARLAVRVSTSGPHVVRVRDLAGDAAGRYRITISTGRRPGALDGGATPPPSRPLGSATE